MLLAFLVYCIGAQASFVYKIFIAAYIAFLQ
jgi:hypothetical protein